MPFFKLTLEGFLILKLATAGKKWPNFYLCSTKFVQQRRWSRSIHLNASHVVFFKSPSAFQQFHHIGRQFDDHKVIQMFFELATNDTCGRLLIDIGPRTSG